MGRFAASGWPSAAVFGLVLGARAASSAGYEELRAAFVERCRAIDPDESQSGLLFNPDGYRSFYVRSECFQRAAVQFRDTDLCDEVKRRWSLFSSSWGYSRKHCRELVAEGADADRARLEEARELHRRGSRGPAGYWSDAFVESVFPARERTQSLEREVRF